MLRHSLMTVMCMQMLHSLHMHPLRLAALFSTSGALLMERDALPTYAYLYECISELATPIHNGKVASRHHLHLHYARHTGSSARL